MSQNKQSPDDDDFEALDRLAHSITPENTRPLSPKMRRRWEAAKRSGRSPHTFESIVTKGNALWILSVEQDSEHARVLLRLTHDPDTMRLDRTVEFRRVTKVQVQWTDRDEACMESVIGLHENVRASAFTYCIATDQREITIETLERATVERV